MNCVTVPSMVQFECVGAARRSTVEMTLVLECRFYKTSTGNEPVREWLISSVPGPDAENPEGRYRARKETSKGSDGDIMSKHIGSTLDSMFEDLGELEEVDLLTQRKLLARRIERAMARKRLSKSTFAKAMSTSRAQIDRLLDPAYTGVTFETLWKASKVLGIKLLAS